MNVKLSIIIPAYNAEVYIGECIDSLLNQDLSNDDYEIIVINDGSTDKTLKILKSYSSKYSNIKIFSQENKGLSNTRNRGLDIANGEYILFVDADDILVSKSLRKVLSYTVKHNLDFLGFGIEAISTRKGDKTFNTQLDIVVKGTGNDLIENFNYSNGVWWYIFKKRKIGDLRFVSNIFAEDALFTPRLILMMDKCVVIKNKVYLYYDENPNSITKTRTHSQNIKMFKDHFYGVKNFNSLFSEFELNGRQLKKLRERQESFMYFGIIRFLRLHTDFYIVDKAIKNLQFENYNVYPIKNFKGYNKIDKLLLHIINNRFLFRSLNYINSKIKIIY